MKMRLASTAREFHVDDNEWLMLFALLEKYTSFTATISTLIGSPMAPLQSPRLNFPVGTSATIMGSPMAGLPSPLMAAPGARSPEEALQRAQIEEVRNWELTTSLLDRLSGTVDIIERTILGPVDLSVVPVILGAATSSPKPSSQQPQGANVTPLPSKVLDEPISPLALLFDHCPCIHCHLAERSFHQVSIETIKSNVCFLPSTVVFRLRELVDVRQVLLEMHPTRRGIAPMIENVDVHISSVFAEPNIDLATMALDESMWEKVAVLSNFANPPSAASASASVGSGPPPASQLVGVLATSTGASSTRLQASETVVTPAPAMFIKFTFNLSKDRGDSDRLFCPRCSKPVVSDHGVCSNCSEMVFQCRQCRNINYEDLRSFLCVQCGFCRHFRFHFKVEMRASKDFSVIRSEKELEVAVRQLRSLTQLEDTAWASVQSARSAVLHAIETKSPSVVESDIKTANLRKKYLDAKWAREDAAALRARMVEYRRGAPHHVRRFPECRPIGQEDLLANPGTGCFACNYTVATALNAATAAVLKRPGMAARVSSSSQQLNILLRARDVLSQLHRTPRLKAALIPKSISIGLDIDPLLVMATQKPPVALTPILTAFTQKIDLSLTAAVDAIEFLQALAVHPSAGKPVMEACVNTLSAVLNRIADQPGPLRPGAEKLAVLCMEAVNKIAMSGAPGKRVSFASSRPGHQVKRAKPSNAQEGFCVI